MELVTYHADIYHFGVFEFDSATGELYKNGLRVRINQQSLKLLHLLINSQGRLRTREELRQELWPADTFVDFEHSLNKAVWGLRQALGDFAANPRYIETVTGQGYRFLVTASRSGHPATESGKTRGVESLAIVLPAVPGGNEECAFFVSQLAYRLTNKLSQMRKLRVLAYSAVKQHSLAGMDPCAAGKQLGVNAVLAGENLHYNGNLVLNLELIDVRDGTSLWGTHLKQSCAQAADGAEHVADELVKQLRSALARTWKNSKASATQEPRPSNGRVEMLKRPILRAPFRPKKAFLFA